MGDFDRALEMAKRALTSGRGGISLEAMILATAAYAASRLGDHALALRYGREQVSLLERMGDPDRTALGSFDLGSLSFAAGDWNGSVCHLDRALSGAHDRLPRALARLRLAEALIRSGDVTRAGEELGRFPFETVTAADQPTTLVCQLERVQGLVAAGQGDHVAALRHFDEAAEGWRQLSAMTTGEDPYRDAFIDLGRPPVAGLVELRVELGRVLADAAATLAELGRAGAAREYADEAVALGDATRFDGYRGILTSLEAVRCPN
ncbi:MAG: hypothetical protein HYX33_02595 [Actinobacteria bacterium]|nr:hypothetical protein [Actinomycetota bacterium]